METYVLMTVFKTLLIVFINLFEYYLKNSFYKKKIIIRFLKKILIIIKAYYNVGTGIYSRYC